MSSARAARPTQDVAQAPPVPIVWIPMPGLNGGGGGRPAPVLPQPHPEPPQATTTPDVPAPVTVMMRVETTPPEDTVEPAPSVLANMADTAMAGAASAPRLVAGGGSGQGWGPGNGDGSGPGDDKGFGGEAYRAGNGVTQPVPLRRASPVYTVEAMRARAHGIIIVECVVEPDGMCGAVRVVRAFAPPYGLDREALDAARRWHFRPGTRAGEPVPVLVSLEIEFNIR